MPESPHGKSLLRRMLPFLTVAVCIAALYDGWVFYSRWKSGQDVERERQHAEAERARKTVEMLGGDQLKILSFYASPPRIHPGGQSLLCFGVNGARNVRIDPPVQELHPALSRCFEVSPQRDTEYKLSAEDAAGHTVTQSLAIRVAP
jgi:hypothetical protein